jgi:hydroxypyruvate isomerase
LSSADEVAAIIAKIGEPNVRMLFDVYRVQITEGDLTRRLERHRSLIGHVQIAAVPLRAEPDEGEVSDRAIFETLDAIGCEGLVAMLPEPRDFAGFPGPPMCWRARKA